MWNNKANIAVLREYCLEIIVNAVDHQFTSSAKVFQENKRDCKIVNFEIFVLFIKLCFII